MRETGPRRSDLANHPCLPVVFGIALAALQILFLWSAFAGSTALDALPALAALTLLPWLIISGLTAVALSAASVSSESRAPWLRGVGWGLFAAIPGLSVFAESLSLRDYEPIWLVLAVLCLSIILSPLRHRSVWVCAPIAFVAVVYTLPYGRSLPPKQPSETSEQIVVLLTLDTFRADHMSAIGGGPYPVQTPHLDALAQRGVLFEEGVAPAPVTGPSHVGLLTGAPPSDANVVRNGDVLSADIPTLATRLADQGWSTGAFVSSLVLDRRMALDRGFHHYDDRFGPQHHTTDLSPWPLWHATRWGPRKPSQRDGHTTVAHALQWLDQVPEGPTFLWIHLYDTHAPYTPTPLTTRFDAKAPTAPGNADEVEKWRQWRTAQFTESSLKVNFFDRDMRALIARYAAETEELDTVVGELVAGLPDHTQWVIAADHGESLLEHGYFVNHGRHVFQATARVPLIVISPNHASGKRVTHPVPSWLVGGTLARMTHLEAEQTLDDYIDTVFTSPIYTYTVGQESRPVFGLGPNGPELALRRGNKKWIVAKNHPPWLFSLDEDPTEERPSSPQPSEEFGLLQQQFDALQAVPNSRTDDGAVRAWLESLGYVD